MISRLTTSWKEFWVQRRERLLFAGWQIVAKCDDDLDDSFRDVEGSWRHTAPFNANNVYIFKVRKEVGDYVVALRKLRTDGKTKYHSFKVVPAYCSGEEFRTLRVAKLKRKLKAFGPALVSTVAFLILMYAVVMLFK